MYDTAYYGTNAVYSYPVTSSVANAGQAHTYPSILAAGGPLQTPPQQGASFNPSHECIQKGPVRGISFKLQEERERTDNYVPEVSAFDVRASVGGLEVDSDTKDLLVALNFADIPVTIVNPVLASQDRPRRERRNVPGAAPRT
ncbi:hypothetical protein ONZ45_g1993 [Pleurotus djamor]|nr:hypothetical protein ONZ45_g1993 [Pleurotus djamor]